MPGTPPPIKRQKSYDFETPPPSIASTETPDTLILGEDYNNTDNVKTPIIDPDKLTTNNLRGKRLDFDNDNDDYLKGRIELVKEGLLSEKRKYDGLYNDRVEETRNMKFTLPSKLNLLKKGGKKSKKRNKKSKKRNKKSKKSKKRNKKSKRGNK